MAYFEGHYRHYRHFWLPFMRGLAVSDRRIQPQKKPLDGHCIYLYRDLCGGFHAAELPLPCSYGLILKEKSVTALAVTDFLCSVEGIAADKFPDKTGRRNLIVHIRFPNIIENFDHILHLFIADILRLDGRKQREDMLLQHRKLIECGGIENHIRMFLIRKNIWKRNIFHYLKIMK